MALVSYFPSFLLGNLFSVFCRYLQPYQFHSPYGMSGIRALLIPYYSPPQFQYIPSKRAREKSDPVLSYCPSSRAWARHPSRTVHPVNRHSDPPGIAIALASLGEKRLSRGLSVVSSGCGPHSIIRLSCSTADTAQLRGW